jgi:hypothetical protein
MEKSMLSRWSGSKKMMWIAVALVSGCSSEETGNTPVGTRDGGVSDAGDNAAGNDGPPRFSTDIWPILTVNCGTSSCHGNDSFFPQHAQSDVELAYEEAQPRAELLVERVSGEVMPIMPMFCGSGPGSGQCLSVAQVDLIRAWAEAGAPY